MQSDPPPSFEPLFRTSPFLDTIGPLFAGNAGARLAAAFDVPLLAHIPFVPSGGHHAALPESLIAAVSSPTTMLNAERP